jgi:hypothetical protein
MKKMFLAKCKKLVVLVLTFVVCLLSSCRIFYTDKPAPTLKIPNKTDITGVCVGMNLETREDEESIEKAIAFLLSATPTRYESVNDTPYADCYYGLSLETTEGSEFFGYFYEEKRVFGLISKWYLEMPYSGIYEVSEDCVLALLEK